MNQIEFKKNPTENISPVTVYKHLAIKFPVKRDFQLCKLIARYKSLRHFGFVYLHTEWLFNETVLCINVTL